MEEWISADGCVVVYGKHRHKVADMIAEIFPGEIMRPVDLKECWSYLEDILYAKAQLRNGICVTHAGGYVHTRVNEIATTRMTAEYNNLVVMRYIARMAREYKVKCCSGCIQSSRTLVIVEACDSEYLYKLMTQPRTMMVLVVVVAARNLSLELTMAAHKRIFTDIESVEMDRRHMTECVYAGRVHIPYIVAVHEKGQIAQ